MNASGAAMLSTKTSDDDVRGEPFAVEFWQQLREEVRYDSVDELVDTIRVDDERNPQIVPEADRR